MAVSSGVITGLLGLATYTLVHEEIERQINQRIKIEADALLDHRRDHGFAALVKLVNTRDRRSAPDDLSDQEGTDESGRGMGYIVTDALGTRRAGSLIAAMPPPGWSEFVHFHKPDGKIGIAQAINMTLPDGGQLVVAADRSIVDEMDLSLLELFVVGFGLILAVGTTAVIGLGRLVRRRLSAIEVSATAIMAGDFTRRIPVHPSGDEFDRLSLILNRMLDRIQALLDNLKQISSDIAHDLRTPLSRLRTRLEAVEQISAGTPQQPLLVSAIDETDDLLELFSAILAISEIEGQSARSRFLSVDLKEAVEEIVEAYRPAIEQAGMTFNLSIATATVLGDRKLLQRCIDNLLDNVLVHTKAGTTIMLSVEKRQNMVALTIADNGPGIPSIDQERVFQRLTRLDRSRSTPGHGLGLNMVSVIVSAHDGRIQIVPTPVGLTVEILLPVAV
ncbi:HAMP domain-containing sensor histidine kinase [Aquisediminimonas sediminicola]|uniref:HAMP domain-containing sensor histidine kinase n=1 Tax=Alteraquisediminimonas sediminicola TaxID=2676787 RepID=UPI001FECA975|nr:HAMP domain-containing sensor histidine kinase [Aquisediminimonas sediminicola]